MTDAGRDLDALVAETVFGLRTVSWHGDLAIQNGGETYAHALPHFSTEIAAAWSVVEHLRGRVVIDHWWGSEYKVMIYIPSSGRPSVEATASTAPEAICRAALLAVGQAVVR